MSPGDLLAALETIGDAPEGVERLRELVLELAVRGMLTDRRVDDGDAHEQVRLGQLELKKQSGQRNRGRWKPIAGVKVNEQPFDLPEGWAWGRINDTGFYTNGLAFKAGDWKESGTPIIRIQNLTDANKPFNYVQGEFAAEARVASGDILVSWSATLEAFEWTGGDAYLNQHIFKVEPCPKVIEKRFLFWMLRQAIRDMAASQHAHGLVMKHINRGPFLQHVVGIPPLAEQRRIVARVDELMALLDEFERTRDERDGLRASFRDSALDALQNAEDAQAAQIAWSRIASNLDRCITDPADVAPLRQTILQLAVRGRLVPQDAGDEPASRQMERISEYDPIDQRSPKGTVELVEDLVPLPNGWTYAPLADLVSVLNGRAYKKTELLDKGTPVLRVGNLFTSKDWYYSDLELEPDKYCNAGDLLFAWSASFGPFIWAGPRVIYHYHIWKLEPHCESEVNRHYLRLFLQNETETIKASGHGLAMIHMTKAKMERLHIPLPPLAEQRRIVAKVDELLSICDELETKLTEARDRQSAFAAAAVHHLDLGG